MKIGIDVDDVLADYVPIVIKFHNDMYNTNITFEKFHSLQFSKVWGGTSEEATAKMKICHASSYFKDIPLIEGTINAINILQQNNELIVVTSRQDNQVDETYHWLNKNFPEKFSQIIFTSNHYLDGKQYKKSKSNVCAELGITILIDDSLEYALDCAQKEIKVFMPNKPWNQTPNLPENIRRVFSWEEIVHSIAALPI